MESFKWLLILIIFLMIGCAGAPTGNDSDGASNKSGNGLNKEQLKQIETDDNPSYY